MKVKNAVLTVAVLCAVSLMLSDAASAQGFMIRLEKDVPASAVSGRPTIEVKMYTSPLLTADPLVTELISPSKVWVGVYTSFTGQTLYNVRLDFTKTGTLTRGMELWWDFFISGNRVGRRERLPQSAWALFAVEADMADTAGDADTVDGLHAADIVAGAVPDGSITTAKLADNAVTAAKIAADSVGASEIAPNSIGSAEIGTGAVGSSEVIDNSLTANDLATNSVTAAEIAAGAVGTSEVADNSLTANDLATNSVAAAEIAAGAVGTSEVADNSLTASDLAANSVGASEISSGAVVMGSADISWPGNPTLSSDCGNFTVAPICPGGTLSLGLLQNCSAATARGTFCDYDSGCTLLDGFLDNCGAYDIYLKL